MDWLLIIHSTGMSKMRVETVTMAWSKDRLILRKALLENP